MYQLLLGIILMVVVEFQYPAVIAYGILIAGRTLAYKTCICKGLDIIAVKCNVCSPGTWSGTQAACPLP